MILLDNRIHRATEGVELGRLLAIQYRRAADLPKAPSIDEPRRMRCPLRGDEEVLIHVGLAMARARYALLLRFSQNMML